MSELLPCPFCGGRAIEFKELKKPYDYGVRCRGEGCEATIRKCASNYLSIKAWNTRKKPKHNPEYNNTPCLKIKIPE